MERNEEYLVYIKNEEEFTIEKILITLMAAWFATMFKGVRHGRLLIL